MKRLRFAAAAGLPASLLIAGLTGCSADMTGYPSLAPRKIESAANAAPEAPAPAPTITAPAGTPPALAKIVADAGAADAAFQAELGRSRAQIEKGAKAPAGSEAWIVAQQAYSALDTVRAPVASALAELDRLRQQAVDKGEDESAIAAATQQVQAVDEAQRALLAELEPKAD